MKVIHTNSFEETQMVGQNFAREILAAKPQKTAVVLALRGDLGAGKTTFLQGFAKGLGIKEVVNSPTFIVMKKFQIPKNKKVEQITNVGNLFYQYFYHFDLYRLENEKDVEFLHFDEIISNPENIVAIEWPEKIVTSLRAKRSNLISITFNHLQEVKREITIDASFF